MGGHRHKVLQAQLTAIASGVWQELVEVVGSTSIVFGFTPSRPGRKPRAKEEASLKACREILGDTDFTCSGHSRAVPLHAVPR
jgi:hypothetical protein